MARLVFNTLRSTVQIYDLLQPLDKRLILVCTINNMTSFHHCDNFKKSTYISLSFVTQEVCPPHPFLLASVFVLVLSSCLDVSLEHKCCRFLSLTQTAVLLFQLCFKGHCLLSGVRVLRGQNTGAAAAATAETSVQLPPVTPPGWLYHLCGA